MNFNEQLSIPVEKALSKIHQDSKVGGNDIAIFLAAVILAGLPIFLSSVGLSIFKGNFLDIGRYMSVGLILAIPIIIGSSVLKRITKNRKMLSLYKDHPNPLLELDKEEMNIPVILLPYKSWGNDYANDQPFLKVAWNDIVSWNSVYIPEDQYTGERGIAAFNIQTPTRTITIERDYLEGKEQEIINFASRFIKIPVNVLEHKKREKIDLWVHRLTWGFISLFALLGIALAFICYFYVPHY